MKGKDLGFKFWALLAVSAIGMGVVLAFVAGFLLGHFTGHSGSTTTTVAAATSGTSATAEAAEEEAEAEAMAEAEAAEAAEAEAEEEEKVEAEEAAAAEEAKEESSSKEPAGGGKQASGAEESSGGEAALVVGKEIVESTCSACHTLSEAGASGMVGPNLDELKPSKSLVETQVTNGGGGMPAFGGTFSKSEIEAVAEYVSKVAGTGDTSAG